MSSRRDFLLTSAATLLTQALPQAPTTRPNIAQIDRDRILTAAAVPTPPPTTPQSPDSAAFLAFTLSIPALAAACIVDKPNAATYRASAATQLNAWFADPATALPTAPTWKTIAPINDLAPLAELSLALPFLALDAGLLAQVRQWFSDYLGFLIENRTALLARDAKDHHASAWLLQATAAARLSGNDSVLADCRHRFKTSTIRAQINADGLFPHELTGENPYRNSLFNLDLLGGVCMLLSTQFESVWDTELQDGPGMRAAVARHAVYIRDRVKWPYPADATHFHLLPCRRPALVFAGRAYASADYVTLWRSITPADPTNPDILRTFPIRQPILWLPQPRA